MWSALLSWNNEWTVWNEKGDKGLENNQYSIDILTALAERTIKRLWVLIILLIVLLFGTNAAWIYYESQFEEYTITQDVEQEADDNGSNENRLIVGDTNGSSEG